MPSLKSFAGEAAKAAVTAIPVLAPKQSGKVLRKIMELAIDGKGKKVFPGAKEVAGKELEQAKGDASLAVKGLIKDHTVLAASQGFVTNLGGFATALATVPANLIGVAVIQSRLVAAIAHLRGYDIDDPKVRAAIIITLLGRNQVEKLVDAGVLPSTPMAVATAPVFDNELEQQASEKILSALLTQIGGKQAVSFVAKKIPVIGGGVGAATDGFSTHSIGQYAANQFPSRRFARRG
jgi:hypothetical protein